jgi:electron transfer flavoprotein beta subunit
MPFDQVRLPSGRTCQKVNSHISLKEMNIIVCIKQVPDTTEVRIDPETKTLIREGVESIINPFDCYALEEGVRLKERFGGTVTAICMGPPQAEKALREAISLGADAGILISDRAFAGSDTLATSYSLSRAITKIGAYDIIICGKQAIDGDTAQVGPGIAVHLGMPQITYVRKIENISDGTIRAERMTEEGYDVVESQLPVMLTVVKEINEPRIASLKGKMAARKAEIPVWTAEDIEADPDSLGLEGSPTMVVEIFTPPPRPGGKLIEGEPADVAAQLIAELKEQKLL